MTPAVEQLLHSFGALSDSEKQQVAAEILRRSLGVGDVPESALVEAADELFSRLEADETGHPKP